MIDPHNTGGVAITWFTLALMVAGIAQGKNRSGFWWFIISAIVSAPIALFILVVFFDKLPATSARKIEPEKAEDDEEVVQMR